MYKWNLNDLYESFESNDFQQALKDIEALSKKAIGFESKFGNDYKLVEEYLKLEIDILTIYRKLLAFCSLTSSADTANKEAKKYTQSIQKIINTMTVVDVKAKNWISGFDIKELTEQSSFLKEHEFYLTSIQEKNKYILDEKTEAVVARLARDGSTSFSNQQAELLSNLEVEFRGEVYPATSMGQFFSSKDAKTRKDAFIATELAYSKIAESVAFSLNSVKGWVNTMCDVRGYGTALDKTLVDSRMSKKTLDSLLQAIEEYLPEFRKFLKHKGKLLGYETGLPLYDYPAPVGNSDKKYSIEEAESFVLKNFKLFSDDLHDLAKRAFDENWIDYEPRKGKRGGAFCYNIPPIKQSRILHNYTGNFSGVVTLAHELGHAYHGNCIFENSLLNSNYTMPVAETASIMCENIVINNALKEASHDEKVVLLNGELTKATAVCVDILSRFKFESAVFENRESKFMNSSDLCEMMLESQREVYGDGVDHNFLSKYAWINKPHYYRPALSYYNFPYAFGSLFGDGLYAKYNNNPEEFKSNYTEMLKATGYKNVEDVASMLDIDVTDIDFWRSSLEKVKKNIEMFIELTK